MLLQQFPGGWNVVQHPLDFQSAEIGIQLQPGLCVFDKRAILFGSEGSARIFTSEVKVDRPDLSYPPKTNHPIAVVEAVDPVLLNMRLVDGGSSRTRIEATPCSL